MKAAVTEAPGIMEIADVPDPGEPGNGEVLVRPEAVGLCGSDFHYFHGDLGLERYPRVQGHEFAGVLDAVGPDCPARLRAGERVAVWPVTACGHCYPCRIATAHSRNGFACPPTRSSPSATSARPCPR